MEELMIPVSQAIRHGREAFVIGLVTGFLSGIVVACGIVLMP